MGGKKKLTLKQIEKQQLLRERKASRGEKTVREKRVGSVLMPDPQDPEVLEELKKMNVVTPYLVASRFGLRLSVAKDMLEMLEERGLLERVATSRYTRIYRFAS